MGSEVVHSAEYETICDYCENVMVLNFICDEYPVGVINHTDIQGNGVKKIIDKCTPNLWEDEVIYDEYTDDGN